MNNVFNIAPRNTTQPLYSLEMEFEGFHIVVEGHDLNKVREEMQAEMARIETIVLENVVTKTATGRLHCKLFPDSQDMDDLRQQMADCL
jgi:hypothetical protein